MEEKVIKGDFKLIKSKPEYSNTKWLDTLTSCVISHWDDGMPAIHILYNYSNGDYSREISCLDNNLVYYLNRGGLTGVEREGINIKYNNTPMDNIKVSIGCVLDRFRKQVMGIVDLSIDKS